MEIVENIESINCDHPQYIYVSADGISERFIGFHDGDRCLYNLRVVHREFSSPLIDCSNENILCIGDGTGLEFSIPRNIGSLGFREILNLNWNSNNYNFRVSRLDSFSPQSPHYIIVERMFRGETHGTYTFSRACGLVSYSIAVQNFSNYQNVEEALESIPPIYRDEARAYWGGVHVVSATACGFLADWWG